jgi:hypothetical protein
LHVYYGGEMFEKAPEDRNDPQYKMMVARLYNAGVNAVKLKEAFGADRKTMQCWGDALNSADVERLVRVLAGREARRKLNSEIRAFVRTRFPCIYRENPSTPFPRRCPREARALSIIWVCALRYGIAEGRSLDGPRGLDGQTMVGDDLPGGDEYKALQKERQTLRDR